MFPPLDIEGADRACSGCLIPLVGALRQLHEEGVRLRVPLVISIGKEAAGLRDAGLLIGDCAGGPTSVPRLAGCPPQREALVVALRRVAAG
jgi:hypothetical protein